MTLVERRKINIRKQNKEYIKATKDCLWLAVQIMSCLIICGVWLALLGE